MKKHPLIFDTVSSALMIFLMVIISLITIINLNSSPQNIWFIIPGFVILWWPLTIFLNWLDRRGE